MQKAKNHPDPIQLYAPPVYTHARRTEYSSKYLNLLTNLLATQ